MSPPKEQESGGGECCGSRQTIRQATRVNISVFITHLRDIFTY